MAKKNYTIYANCQGHALSKVLNSSKNFSDEYNYIPIKPVQNITISELDNIIESVIPLLDLFIYQPISSQYKNHSKYSSQGMVEILKSSCQFISFPSCYFRGYNPEIITLKNRERMNISVPLVVDSEKRLNALINDSNIILGFLEKKSVLEIKSSIIDNDFYSQEFIEKILQKTFCELTKREEKFKINVCISSFISNNFKNERLFYTANHPTNILIKFIAESILNILKIEKDFNKIPEVFSFLSCPIYASARNILQLQFSSSLKYSILGESVDLENIIQQYMTFYETIPQEILKKNIEGWQPI